MIKLTKSELMILSSVVGRVSVPIVSDDALNLKELINKMAKMIDEISKEEKDATN